ncbi:hypothetical protein [Methanobrevibacter sp.]|uniref:hypothetical protein n=1 Tax=Methanobrevibacter sp. TaxID=66852 RepID=UPI002E79DF9A|nr:hypothetical protein [Methanobrevibacter sp.]MEE0939678.1 hypothetical protein [Methanobrevibacter sp.]
MANRNLISARPIGWFKSQRLVMCILTSLGRYILMPLIRFVKRNLESMVKSNLPIHCQKLDEYIDAV